MQNLEKQPIAGTERERPVALERAPEVASRTEETPGPRPEYLKHRNKTENLGTEVK
jgi:hypothetical protein